MTKKPTEYLQQYVKVVRATADACCGLLDTAKNFLETVLEPDEPEDSEIVIEQIDKPSGVDE